MYHSVYRVWAKKEIRRGCGWKEERNNMEEDDRVVVGESTEQENFTKAVVIIWILVVVSVRSFDIL